MDNKSCLKVPGWESAEDRLAESFSSINSSQWRLDDNCNDKYTAAIELSNKCREFYKSRLEAANDMKSRWQDRVGQRDDSVDNNMSLSSSSSSSSMSDVSDNDKTSQNKQQRQRVDQAIEKLRAEMASLMDQDLSLMKQLLTLNEIIEDLKWQRQYSSYSTSWTSFSASNHLESHLSVSDTEMYVLESGVSAAQKASCSSVQVSCPKRHNLGNVRPNSTDLLKIPMDADSSKVGNLNSLNNSISAKSQIFTVLPVTSTVTTSSTNNKSFTGNNVNINGPVTIRHERGEDSFDSGIHEVVSGDELAWSN